MAHLAIVGSHSVNGVAQVHTELLKNKIMHGFNQFYPQKFSNKTNGVTHRRWLMKINPELTELINDAIGADWVYYPCDLLRLLKYENDDAFLQGWSGNKKRNYKILLARHIKEQIGFFVNPDSIFDAQIKRFHGYKRQTMNVLYIMHLYNLLRKIPILTFFRVLSSLPAKQRRATSRPGGQ